MLVRGTYVYAKLIPHIASWVSVEFGYQVSCIIEDFVVRDYQQKLKMVKDEVMELSELCAQTEKQVLEKDEKFQMWTRN